VQRNGAFDDLAVAAAQEVFAVVAPGHRPGDMAGEELADDIEQNVFVVGQRAVEVEDDSGPWAA
jgi:hypothetical protein